MSDFSTLTITNTIESGAAFGVMHGTGATCYIPAAVVFSSDVKAGDVIEAILVENPNVVARERTPYMARFVVPHKPESAASGDVTRVVQETLAAGGVWTDDNMFEVIAQSGVSASDKDVADALYMAFQTGKCARFTLHLSPDAAAADEVWYTAYPEKADVDEYDE